MLFFINLFSQVYFVMYFKNLKLYFVMGLENKTGYNIFFVLKIYLKSNIKFIFCRGTKPVVLQKI